MFGEEKSPSESSDSSPTPLNFISRRHLSLSLSLSLLCAKHSMTLFSASAL